MKHVENSKGYSVDREGNVYSQYEKYRKLNKNNLPVGYKNVSIKYNDGTTKRKLVHRLVAEAYIPNPDNKPLVNHINSDKSDNRVENLEWVTSLENVTHARSAGAWRIGDTPVNAVYSVEEIKEVCRMLEDGRRNIDIIRNTKVDRATVYGVRSGITWTHISSEYKFSSKSKFRKVSDSTIKWVCTELVKGTDTKSIAGMLDNKLTRQDVWKIKVKLLYQDISVNYF